MGGMWDDHVVRCTGSRRRAHLGEPGLVARCRCSRRMPPTRRRSDRAPGDSVAGSGVAACTAAAGTSCRVHGASTAAITARRRACGGVALSSTLRAPNSDPPARRTAGRGHRRPSEGNAWLDGFRLPLERHRDDHGRRTRPERGAEPTSGTASRRQGPTFVRAAAPGKAIPNGVGLTAVTSTLPTSLQLDQVIRKRRPVVGAEFMHLEQRHRVWSMPLHRVLLSFPTCWTPSSGPLQHAAGHRHTATGSDVGVGTGSSPT